ncbi:MAG: LacI family transcriptional regulator [Lachnospiraceae bacterium]|nr:LacI family transcriptional regulator [Lachnospiraceae bacterium]
MVSIRDVAAHAGVAISTVSKVINHYPNVSEATRVKVEQAIEELGFVPNTIAAALSSKQSGRVALLLKLNKRTNAADEIAMQYIAGAIQRARALSMDVVTVFYSMLEDKSVEDIIRYFETQGVSGIIIYSMDREDEALLELLKTDKFKFVLVDAPMTGPNISSVSIDNRQAQKDVVLKTAEQNDCSKILYIAGEESGYVTGERIAGIKELAKEEGYKLKIVYGDFSEKKARELTLRFAKRYSAVVCASDLMAIGAMRALMEMDIFRPVCGFDGIVLMGYAGKQMNTVKQDFENVSAEAMTELHNLLGGSEGRALTLPHTLVRMKYEDVIM